MMCPISGAGDVLAAAGAEVIWDGVVSVLGLGLDLGDGAGAGLVTVTGSTGLLIVDLGHAELRPRRRVTMEESPLSNLDPESRERG